MTTSVTMSVADAVQAALDGKRNVIRCPSHDDSSPSLSVGPGKTQPVLLNCHAGCDPQQILVDEGLDWAELCKPMDDTTVDHVSKTWTPAGNASAIYPYRDETGQLLFEVLRVDLERGKRIMQRRPDPSAPHGHSWNLDGVTRVLYRLPEVLKAVRDGRTIHIPEGEKCVHALLDAIPEGEEATTNPMGAGKWEPQYSAALAGANVILYADADAPGRLHARTVRESLLAHGCTVRVLEAPPGMVGDRPINDVADHLAASKPLDAMLETTPEQEVERAKTGFDVLDVILRPMSRVEFAIPGTLAKGERLILLGFEGTGKSTLCRQIAVQVAVGLHPFTLAEAEPRRVLFIDAENHPEQVQESWAQLVGLAARHDHPVQRGMLTILEEHEGLNTLDTPDGCAWLMERVHAYQPDLVVMGPLTNLANKDLRDDEPVRRIKNAVNAARSICNSAFIMEHHAPLKGPMDKERQLRPYGSSLFLKWPDYGYGIKPTDREGLFEWHKNRGPRVRARHWPEALSEGKPNTDDWPWLEAVLPD